MSNKLFQYSILKYRPSYVLEEEMNIGLLFYFVDDNRVEFIHPMNLTRILYLHPEMQERNLRAYLKGFRQKAQKFSKSEIANIGQINKVFLNYFLPKDASNLYFSEVKKGSYQNMKKTLLYYIKMYFSLYVEGGDYESLLPKNTTISIAPEYKSKIEKLDESFVYLPRLDEIKFLLTSKGSE